MGVKGLTERKSKRCGGAKIDRGSGRVAQRTNERTQRVPSLPRIFRTIKLSIARRPEKIATNSDLKVAEFI